MRYKLLVIFCALALIVCAALLIASVEKEDAQKEILIEKEIQESPYIVENVSLAEISAKSAQITAEAQELEPK